MVDENTRMDRATVGPGARITYHYTFPNHNSRNIDLSWLHQNLRPVVINQVCSNKDMGLSLQYGGIYAYSYSGNDGAQIESFEIDQNVCGFQKVTP